MNKSPRPTVRPFTEADEPALRLLLADEAVMRYLEPPFSPERTRAFLREAGLCGRRVRVRLRGGALEIEWRERDGHILMTGPAVTVFEGELID